jgi:hypothetical protein
VVKVEMTFYSSREWESGDLGRVAGGGDVNLMILFRFEKGGGGRKRGRKIKRR